LPSVTLALERVGDSIVACRGGVCAWLEPNRDVAYYIMRLGLINATCEDSEALAKTLGMPPLATAYCSSNPTPELVPKPWLGFRMPRFIVKLPSNPSLRVLGWVGFAKRYCQAVVENDALVITSLHNLTCRAVLVGLLTLLNNAFSLVIDGRIVVFDRSRVCVDGDCTNAGDCSYGLYRWLRACGLGRQGAVFVCGLVLLINNPTAGGTDHVPGQESEPEPEG
jgi:hypothetical protein